MAGPNTDTYANVVSDLNSLTSLVRAREHTARPVDAVQNKGVIELVAFLTDRIATALNLRTDFTLLPATLYGIGRGLTVTPDLTANMLAIVANQDNATQRDTWEAVLERHPLPATSAEYLRGQLEIISAAFDLPYEDYADTRDLAEVLYRLGAAINDRGDDAA